MSRLNLELPQLSPFSTQELDCLARWLPRQSKDSAALLFGLSGCAKFLMESGLWKLHALDDELDWIQSVSEDPFFDFFIRRQRLKLHHADMGPQQAWGYPATNSNPLWLRYHTEIWQKLEAPESIDMVVLDGRFRVASACQCLLRCRPEALFFVHDFAERHAYHVLLDFMEPLERAGSGIMLRLAAPEQPASWRKVALTLQQYQFDWR